ncbi:PREDICTED: putative uncharacterized protein DDB_G0282133 [Papilio polytes]|uniref:putative uncharacterized protein DDB_G0282133 n=1 Tax=Papilio polytes TaxID=76194 RepID=UPI0006760121|nr:PREDICTED: putative uncharacterized protein DDB_G0282133 [Papilio polytes]
MSPTILWLFYCFAVPNVRSDVELAASLNSDSSLESNVNSDANSRNDLDLTRLNSDSNSAVSEVNLNLDSDSANRLSRQNEQDSNVASANNQDMLRSNLNGVGVYDFTNHANLRHPSLGNVNGVLKGLEALHHANAVKNGRLNVVTRSGLNDQNQVSVDGSQLALIALNKHGVVGNGVSGLSGLNVLERNGLTNSRGLKSLENVIVQRSALHEVNSDNVNGVNNVNLNGDKENLLSTVNRWAVVSKHHLGDLLNNNLEQNLNDQHTADELNGQSESNGLSRSGVSGVYYRSGNVHGVNGVSHGNLGLNHGLVNSNADNLVKLRLSGANLNGVNSLNLLNNVHSNDLENHLNLEHQNVLLNRVHNHANDVENVLGDSNLDNSNLLKELSRSGLLGAANLNNQKVSLNALKEATKLGLQQPVLLDRSVLMGRSGSGLNEEDLLNAVDHHNEGKLNALSALVTLSDVNNNNLRNALNNLANQKDLSRSGKSNLNGLDLVRSSNLHRNSNGLTSSSGLHASNVNSLKSSKPALLVNSLSPNSLSNGLNVDGESGLNSLNTPEPSNREHENLSNEENSLDSEVTVETRLPAAEIELETQNRRYLGNGLRNLVLGHSKGWGPNKVVYSPYDLPNPVPYRPYNRPVPRPYRPQGWYQPYTTYVPYALKGRSGLNDDIPLSNDALDLSALLLNMNNLNDVGLNNKLVDLTDYDIDNLLSLFEKTELNGLSIGKNELRSGVEVNSDNLVSELDALNQSELNTKNLNNRRILSNILRRLHSGLGKNAKVANNDLLNLNANAQNGLNKLVGVDSLAVKSNNLETVNDVLKLNANEQNLDVESVANARRYLMRHG